MNITDNWKIKSIRSKLKWTRRLIIKKCEDEIYRTVYIKVKNRNYALFYTLLWGSERIFGQVILKTIAYNNWDEAQ
jgi:hypothetical protein